MYTSFCRACLLLVGLVFSLSVHAAGLGKLTINSSLGQPLNAEIDLVSVSEEELSTLKAEFASREAFAQAGIRYEPFFPTFQTSIESRIDGTPYIKITSPQSVNEPFLNLLLELSWASGRLLREYTVLLDPEDKWAPETVAPVVPSMPEQLAETNITHSQNESDEVRETDTHENQIRQPISSSPRERYADNTYGPILEGDTLSSIARQVKPESVNLNQMLVALFRANRDAFIADNMNLLRTGAVLKVPAMQELAEIGENEANAEVRVQVNDWHKYRQNLASSTQQLQSADSHELSQTDAGEITTAVDDAAVTGSAPPEEVLRLSSGENLSDSQGYADLDALDRIRMMEEDAIARNLALKEANERVAMLEKNVENLQRLLALQNNELAQAQVNAESQAPVQQSETESFEVMPSDSEPESEIVASDEIELSDEDGFVFEDSVDVDLESEDGLASLTEEGESEIEASSAETVAVLTPPAASVESVSNPVLLPEPEEPSFLDQIMGNMTYIGGFAAVLLLALAAVAFKRRREAAEIELEEENARHQELSSALREKTAAVVAAAHESDGTDEPEQEDDFFSQAESQENDSDIEAELSSEQEEMSAHESSDSEQPIELDFSIENESAENDVELSSDDAVAMDIDSFEDGKSEAEASDDSSHQADDFAADLESSFDEETTEAENVQEDEADNEHLMDFTSEELDQTIAEPEAMEINFDETENVSEQNALQDDAVESESEDESVLESKSEAENALDFSIDTSEIDLTDEDSKTDETTAEESSLDTEMAELELPEMDLSSESLASEMSSDERADLSSDTQAKAPEIDFADIDLDIEDKDEISDDVSNDTGDDTVTSEETAESEVKSEQWHEIETKIDLAKAYLEMEDVEGAREMLEEIVQEGDEAQQNTAKELLEKL